MRKIQGWLLIIDLFVATYSYSQQINGSVVDLITNQRIPFANIYCPKIKKGTLSNENGEYGFPIPSFPVQLVVSHISYQSDTITIVEPTDNYTVHLKPAAHELDPVTVSNAGYKLIKQAFTQVNAGRSIIYGNAFYRQLTKNGSQFTEIQEVTYNIALSSNKIEGVQIGNARYAKLPSDDKKMYLSFTNFSYLVLAQKSISQSKPTENAVLFPVRPDVADYYDVQVTDVLTQPSGDKIAELDCHIREDYTNPAFSGKVYINMNNYKLVKVHGTIPNSMGAVINNAKTLTENYVYTVDVDYTSQANTTVFNSIRVTVEFDQLIRATGEKRKDWVSAFLLINDFSNAATRGKYKPINIHREDLKLIQGAKYDAEFWRNNSVVRRTPLEESTIKAFEQQGVMGNMKFEPQ
ncbi:carboxypeptidase-like regulatory domain-containing protein [Spirosoma sp. KCTC 42546]|uniref:carboxypeptidase-like regulatory domain-containing protein n=1 Tax=Spirosoma sp. KCTC 42546 TaxID=2520506 RepID=UPI00115BB6AB|nr:carboxypeptidase-like regulatory domain-containing protein [Spirosoma sp. KCTC 42546]QDK82485.1 carboxypeptidase-like regulatory domain-containing protein [Spirosoma sp. KCTC 42546]